MELHEISVTGKPLGLREEKPFQEIDDQARSHLYKVGFYAGSPWKELPLGFRLSGLRFRNKT